MAHVYGKAGILKRYFNVYVRKQAAYTRPTSSSEWDTLLGTFTQLGVMERKSVKLDVVGNDKIELDDGTTKSLDYKGNFEAKDVNTTPDNVDDYNDQYDNEDVDILLHDPIHNEARVVLNTTLAVEEHDISGDVCYVDLKTEKVVLAKSSFRDRFTVPTT